MQAPWDQEGSRISKEDRDSIERLIEFDKKHNYYKSLHFKLMMFLIVILTFTMFKYYFNFTFLPGFHPIIDFIFNEKNIIMDLFINLAFLFTATLTHNLREKAKSDFKSLKSEIVDLSNKEWYKKYDEINSQIFEYLYKTYKIRINHKS
ncbi:DUF2663 family protein [Litchfieldia alkalitelluris]|uniref:DUF2663 family protein n=1 Tax=Litchfieldia alkalitelluris TaxID=304268 RepID=UPI00099831FC|nr:DUF2663 family protein [Litchfieldia alkalitelluris]